MEVGIIVIDIGMTNKKIAVYDENLVQRDVAYKNFPPVFVKDSRGNEVKVAANDQIATYIRVYEPAWFMPYGRKGRSAGSADRKELYALMEDGDRDYTRLASIGMSEGCSYLVVPLRDEESQQTMEQSGYQMITTVNHYGVFRLKDKGENE